MQNKYKLETYKSIGERLKSQAMHLDGKKTCWMRIDLVFLPG